jgi:hypothetical protein
MEASDDMDHGSIVSIKTDHEGQMAEKRLKYRERSANRNKNRQKRRKLLREKPDIIELPDTFPLDEMCAILNGQDSTSYAHKFPLTVGLMLKLRSAIKRMYKNSWCKFPRKLAEQGQQFYLLVQKLTFEVEQLKSTWEPAVLWRVAEELSAKYTNLCNNLQKEYVLHPLYPLSSENGKIQFEPAFIDRVNAYHESLKRPEGTFDMKEEEKRVLSRLSQVSRMKCLKCNSCRQIYCGPCGIPMPNALDYIFPSSSTSNVEDDNVAYSTNDEGERLNEQQLRGEHIDLGQSRRVNLPFDVVLLLHYQETLVKCTGVHASVLSGEGSVSYINWNKPTEEWQAVVEALDADNDVILFPYPNSVPATDFDWDRKSSACEKLSSDATSEDTVFVPPKRWRLVVLEASWGYGKTMAQQVIDHRKAKGLSPIKSVILTNITGEYWKFQAEGQSAVSTIEAIAHAAKQAGLSDDKVDNLLILFRLQKYRMLQHTIVGGKIPRAVEVTGDRLGSWKDIALLKESDDNDNEEEEEDESEDSEGYSGK